MENLLNKIEEACSQYLNGELDDAGFQKVIDEIPAELWQDKDAALTIVKTLVNNGTFMRFLLKNPEFLRNLSSVFCLNLFVKIQTV